CARFATRAQYLDPSWTACSAFTIFGLTRVIRPQLNSRVRRQHSTASLAWCNVPAELLSPRGMIRDGPSDSAFYAVSSPRPGSPGWVSGAWGAVAQGTATPEASPGGESSRPTTPLA